MSGPQAPWYKAASARIDEYQDKVRQKRQAGQASQPSHAADWHREHRDHGHGLKFEDVRHDRATQKLDERMERTVAGGFNPARFVTFVLGRPVVVIISGNPAREMFLFCLYAACQSCCA
jgi:hypothetical protein